MALSKITVANFFAKQSCPKWQKNRTIRRICRKIYRYIMEKNTAEYPYSDKNFANWEMSDRDKDYSLISDSYGFVIRHCTSYFAWYIERWLGRKLEIPAPGARRPNERNFDAKHWDEILEWNNFIEAKLKNITAEIASDMLVIGVDPNEGNCGQLILLSRVAGRDYTGKVYKNGKLIERHNGAHWDRISWYLHVPPRK